MLVTKIKKLYYKRGNVWTVCEDGLP